MSKKEMQIIQNVLPGTYGVMPRALDVENAVLGSLLAESATAQKYVPRIESGYFYEPKNQLIFKACQDLVKTGKVIDILTVAQQMNENGTLETAGGPFHITQLSGMVASSAHIEYHILILAQFYLRRRLIEIAMKTSETAGDATVDIDDTLAETLQQISELVKGLPGMNELREMPEVLDKVMAELEERMKNGGKVLTGVDTGFPSLNDLLLGWNKGTVNVIGARPGMGKTAVLVYTLLKAAQQGVPVCLISLESKAENLVERCLLGQTDIDPNDWKRGRLTPEQWEEAQEARRKLENVTIKIFDHGDITVERVCMIAKSLHAERKCEILGIDYMQLFAETGNSAVREQEVAKNSRQLKLLSLKLDIPVIVLTQLNREVITNSKEIPRLENIRESGSVEQDADSVSLLFHPAEVGLVSTPDENKYPVTPDMMMMMVLKNRNGAPGTVYLSHNPSMTKFAEYSPSSDWVKRLPASTIVENNTKEWKENNPNFQAFLRIDREKKENEGKLPF